MKRTLFAAVVVLVLGTAVAATAQVTGGGGSGIGSGPPGALPNGGLGVTDTPASNRDNTVVPPSAGLKDQPGAGLGSSARTYSKDDLGRQEDIGVNEAEVPTPQAAGSGFSDRDVNGRGRALDSTVLGTGPAFGNGLITGSGARIH
jgi:hypothetical protein